MMGSSFRTAITTICAVWMLASIASPASASVNNFGFLPGSSGFDMAAIEADGSPSELAGTHPWAVSAQVNFAEGPESPGQPGVSFPAEDLRDMRFELPSGFIGNPSVVNQCSLAQFATPRTSPFEESASGESCPDKSQVGVVEMKTAFGGGSTRTFGLYNLTPPPGVTAMLGTSPFHEPITFGGQVRNTAGEYGLDLEARNFPQGLPITGVTVTIWGVPWAVSHDGERGNCLKEAEPNFPWAKCSVGAPKTSRPKAFLTLPNSCDHVLVYSVSADSWQHPGAWVGDSAISRNGEGQPQSLRRCDRINFATTSFSRPTTERASSASGFDFNLSVNQEGLVEPEGLAGSQIRKAVVTLPEGFSINPSVGAGLGICTPAQFAAETATSEPGDGCPNNSNIGEFKVESPLVIKASNGQPEVIEGSIYLAEPDKPSTQTPGAENPYDALIGVYLVARAPGNGILVKVAGELVPNQTSGQIVAIFDGMPQIPYTGLRIHFREGQRAPLATPAACGQYTTAVELTPWLSSATVLHQNFEFPVSQGVGGGPCPGSQTPFTPGAENGSVNANAGSYSPFYLHLTRNDKEKEITSYSALLPPGLTGKIADVPYCPESAISAAKEETGIGELEHPHCPAASEIGHTVAGYGLGEVLTYAPGKLYLAGPYHGAPLSIVAVDSALVGPFDLGVIIVRSAIKINPYTAQVSIDSEASDPIPHIIGGIPLHLRDIRVYINRPNFTLNPTNCQASIATSTLSGSSPPFLNPRESMASTNNPYQANNCSALGFKPKLKLSLTGGMKRTEFPALHAVLTERPGDANIGRAAVALPRRELLAQAHLVTACTKKRLEADNCPSKAIYGHARAFSPLLAEPLEGPVYLVGGFGHTIPDLVVALEGDGGIQIFLDGRVDSVRGGMRATFETLPDAPASKFELSLFGGRRSLLQNEANLCAHTAPASVRFVGQNNLGYAPNVVVTTPTCSKNKHSKHHHHGGKGK